MFSDNNVVLIASVFVLVACAAVMVIIFIGAKTMFFMHRTKIQVVGKASPGLPEVKEVAEKEAKPKREWRQMLAMIKLPTRKKIEINDIPDDEDEIDEETGADEPQEVNTNNVVYEEGRGYCFNVPEASPTPDEQDRDPYDDDLDDQDDFEPEEGQEQDEADNELELCREIERLTDETNQIGEAILLSIIKEQSLEDVPELTAHEEYDELPGTVDGLQQEVNRLKNKKNQQFDYIQEFRKKQGSGEDDANNKNADQDFISCVAAAFNNMKKKEFVYKPEKPRGTQDFTYVFSKEFFEALSGSLHEYKQKNVVEELKQRGIVDKSDKGYSQVINGKRMLKVYSKQFDLLTTEAAQDVGA